MTFSERFHLHSISRSYLTEFSRNRPYVKVVIIADWYCYCHRLSLISVASYRYFLRFGQFRVWSRISFSVKRHGNFHLSSPRRQGTHVSSRKICERIVVPLLRERWRIHGFPWTPSRLVWKYRTCIIFTYDIFFRTSYDYWCSAVMCDEQRFDK